MASHLSLDDVGVYLSNSIDSVRSHNAQVCHVDPLAPIFFNQGHCPQLLHVFGVQSRDSLWVQSKRLSARVRDSMKPLNVQARTSRWI